MRFRALFHYFKVATPLLLHVETLLRCVAVRSFAFGWVSVAPLLCRRKPGVCPVPPLRRMQQQRNKGYALRQRHLRSFVPVHHSMKGFQRPWRVVWFLRKIYRHGGSVVEEAVRPLVCLYISR